MSEHMIDVPLTIGDRTQVGRVQIEEGFTELLSHPDLWGFGVAYIERDGVKTLVEVSIVPIAKGKEFFMSTTNITYVCPSCQRATSEATITCDYTPTANDRKLRPEVKDSQAKEQLHCPCGQVYTWFNAMQVTVRDRT